MVEPTHLKNIGQTGSFPQVEVKIKKMKPPPSNYLAQFANPKGTNYNVQVCHQKNVGAAFQDLSDTETHLVSGFRKAIRRFSDSATIRRRNMIDSKFCAYLGTHQFEAMTLV